MSPHAASSPTAVPISEPADMDRLVELLLNPGRRRPVVVVTMAPGHAAPFIDADAITQQSGGGADVYVVPTGPLTFRMADALGAMSCVYGGAGRLYVAGTSWREDPFTSRLRFARNLTEGERATVRASRREQRLRELDRREHPVG